LVVDAGVPDVETPMPTHSCDVAVAVMIKVITVSSRLYAHLALQALLSDTYALAAAAAYPHSDHSGALPVSQQLTPRAEPDHWRRADDARGPVE